MSRSHHSKQHSQFFSATQLVSQFVENYATSSYETKQGMDLLLKVAKQYENCKPSHTQGRLFEIIETTKFNAKAAQLGEKVRAMTTEALGDPHAKADILIKEGEKILKEVQAKSSEKAPWLANAVRREDYGDMDRLVNSDKVDRVKELVDKRAASKGIYSDDYAKASEHLKGELKSGNISSGGTTHQEALDAAKDPSKFALKTNTAQFGKQMFNAARDGAIAGAIVGGGVSAISEGVQVFQGKKSLKDGAAKVGENAAKASANSAVVAGLGKGISYIGQNTILMKGNVATSIAASAVHITSSTIKYVKGEISSDEYVHDLGETGVSTLSGIYAGMAAGVIFGPGGAVVGGVIGLLAGKEAYNALTLAQKDLNLTIEERKRAEELSEILIAQIREEQQALQKLIESEIEEVKGLTSVVRQLNASLTTADFTAEAHNINSAILTLADTLNVEFQYKTKEEFDRFMLNDDEALQL